MRRFWILMITLALVATPALAKKEAAEEPEKDETPMSAKTFSGLEMRNIGPAINSGRVSDFAVQPDAHHIIYVATASGNLWKTVNAGTTWEPIFDKEKSYSIGCVTLDPTVRERTTVSARWPLVTASTRASTAARTGRTWVFRSPSTSA
jgi:hypothetical protein